MEQQARKLMNLDLDLIRQRHRRRQVAVCDGWIEVCATCGDVNLPCDAIVLCDEVARLSGILEEAERYVTEARDLVLKDAWRVVGGH